MFNSKTINLMQQDALASSQLKYKIINRLSLVLWAALVIIFAFLLAVLSWRVYALVFEKQAVALQIKIPQEGANVATSGFSRLAISRQLNQLALFGGEKSNKTSPTSPAVNQASVPKTGLALTLTGLLSSSDPNASMAIIKYQNKQSSYFIGDKIGTTSAKIIQIDPDGVIIDENGKLTRLSYDEAAPVNSSSKPTVAAPQEPAAQSGTVSTSFKEELLAKPEKLFDYISVSPVKENNVLLGYRINPGKEAAMFTDLGFMPGDLAVEINGVDLKDEIQSLSLLSELPEMTELSINVEREGQIYTINLSLND